MPKLLATLETAPCGGRCPKTDGLAAEMAAHVAAARLSGEPIAPAADDPADRVHELNLDTRCSLPLAEPLAHREIDGWHVWIAVHRPALLVLDDADHEVMLRLAAGMPPEAAVAAGASCRTAAEVADRLGPLLGRPASAGFFEAMSGRAGRMSGRPGRSARLHLTGACQLRCIHCYANSSPTVDRTGERPTAWWLGVIEQLAELGTQRVLFTGGEALLHPGCLDLMEAAKARGMHVTLFTNGLLVERVFDRLVAACDEVQVSVDGPTAEVNDAIRGRNVFKRAVRAVELLAETSLQVRVGMTAMAANWDAWQTGFGDFASRFTGTDVSFHLAYGVTEHGRAVGAGQQVDATTRRADVEKLLAGRRGAPAEAECTRRVTGCGYFEQLVIGPDGGLHPCHLFDATLGHVDEQPLSAWVQDYVRLGTLFDVDHTAGCRNCELRYLCGGTCRAVASQQTGSRLRTDCTPAAKAQRYRELVHTYAPNTNPIAPRVEEQS